MRVSLIGLGTVKLGRDQGVSYPGKFSIPDTKSATALLDQARSLGINLIDTAPAYGTSEESLGRLLRKQRQHWLICTKVGEEFYSGASHFNFTPASVKQSIKRSLQRLGTEYLDIALIHSNGDDLEILDNLGTLLTLQELKEQGLIRATGISHKTADGGQRAIALGADVIMTTINRQDSKQLPVVQAAGAQGCGVLIKKALARGHGQPEDLAWVAGQQGVSSIVVGTIDPEHLATNVMAACAAH